MLSVSGGLSLCRQTWTKTAEEGERERERLTKHFLLPRTPLSPRERIFNYRCDKRRHEGVQMQRIRHPTAPSGNRILTTEHAVQISSGSEITEHLPTSVELTAGARQRSGAASCGLMKLPFPFFKQPKQTSRPKVVSSLSHRRWMFSFLHTEHGKSDVINSFFFLVFFFYPYSTFFSQ